MSHRTRAVGALGALGVTVLIGGVLVNAEAAAASTHHKKVPVITAHVSSRSVRLSTGHDMHAGRVIFRVVTGKGGHTLQLARLLHGYSLERAGSDLNNAFGGEVAAVRRVDHNIAFRGGALARPGKPGKFSVTLGAGRYILLDQDSNAHTYVDVHGSKTPRRKVAHTSTITTYTYGFGNTPSVLPASGWSRIRDISDQPHFVIFNHVKRSTTKKSVARYFAHPSDRKPSFALKANTDVGVLSPYRTTVFRYSLPPGRYLLACYWPDDDTGMPHAFMGMWKLVTLR